jgi:hypothetical protein
MSAEVTCSIVIPTKNRPTSLVAAVVSALAALPEGARSWSSMTGDRSPLHSPCPGFRAIG